LGGLFLLPVTGLAMVLVGFFLGSLLACLLLPVSKFLKTKYLLQILVYIIAIIGLFAAYSYLLYYMANVIIDPNFVIDFSIFIERLAQAATAWENPLGPAVSIVTGGNVGLCLLYEIGVIAVLGGLIAVVWLVYKNNFKNGIENLKVQTYTSKGRGTHKMPAFFAIFFKDLKTVIRIQSYAFSYVAVSVAIPIVVFLCNYFLSSAAVINLGERIRMLFTLSVIMLFMSITNSFSATTISREGKQFYITKIMPVSYTKQLMAKILLNILISVIVTLVSVLLVTWLGFISWLDSIIVLVLTFIFSFASILAGLNRNIKVPLTTVDENGEISAKNVSRTAIINIVFLFILICASWVLASAIGQWGLVAFAASVIAAYAIFEIILFLRRIKTYAYIE
jgi:ABC-2 type transport system permease protein